MNACLLLQTEPAMRALFLGAALSLAACIGLLAQWFCNHNPLSFNSCARCCSTSSNLGKMRALAVASVGLLRRLAYVFWYSGRPAMGHSADSRGLNTLLGGCAQDTCCQEPRQLSFR